MRERRADAKPLNKAVLLLYYNYAKFLSHSFMLR